jgi:hypothetical protein
LAADGEEGCLTTSTRFINWFVATINMITDELYPTLFISKGNVMAISEELGYSKVLCLVGTTNADKCTQSGKESKCHLSFAPIQHWKSGLPITIIMGDETGVHHLEPR